MITRYNEAWLRGDSAAILNLFSDSAILIPNGLKPIVGKKEIINFWWPNDSSATKIKEYEIDILEIKGNDNLAYTFENGKLDWSYSKGDFNMSKKQESYEITIFQRTGSGQWTIVKRIWTDLKDAFRN